MKKNHSLKRAVIEVLLNDMESFYLHCIPHPNLLIGQRGLSPQERKEGIVFIFGPQSFRGLKLGEDYLQCQLQFHRWENLRIPYECISRVFDKENRFMMQWATAPLKAQVKSKSSKESIAVEDIEWALKIQMKPKNSKEQKTPTAEMEPLDKKKTAAKAKKAEQNEGGREIKFSPPQKSFPGYSG